MFFDECIHFVLTNGITEQFVLRHFRHLLRHRLQLTDDALEGWNALHLFADTHIFFLSMILDAFEPFQSTCYITELMADVCANAFALRIVDALQHKLQHLLIGVPQRLRLFSEFPTAHFNDFMENHRECIRKVSLSEFIMYIDVIHFRII